MKKYYVSAIIQDKDDKRAWIDCCDENGKKMIFHECYVDCLGQVWKG